MIGARDLLVGALEAVLPPDVNVIGYARTVDNIVQPTVMVRLDRVTPSVQPQAWHTYEFALLLVVGKTEAGPGDDQLDELLLDVLLALEATDVCVWTQAQRSVLDETWPAYQIDLTTNLSKES